MLRIVMIGFPKLEVTRGKKEKSLALLSYDCPFGQVISDEMLRIVMIGFAKLEVT